VEMGCPTSQQMHRLHIPCNQELRASPTLFRKTRQHLFNLDKARGVILFEPLLEVCLEMLERIESYVVSDQDYAHAFGKRIVPIQPCCT
jgi:hypothetical protein